MAIVPPRLGMVQIAPEGIALTLPGKPAAADPIAPKDMDILAAAGGTVADPSWCAIRAFKDAIGKSRHSDSTATWRHHAHRAPRQCT